MFIHFIHCFVIYIKCRIPFKIIHFMAKSNPGTFMLIYKLIGLMVKHFYILLIKVFTYNWLYIYFYFKRVTSPPLVFSK